MSVTLRTISSNDVYPSLTGSYPQIGHALADLALAITTSKLSIEAMGHKVDASFKTTLASARDFASYRLMSTGWTYEDGNIQVEVTFNDDFEPRRERRLFVDSDGVFADFETQVINITGSTIKQLGDERMWQLIGGSEPFWKTMPTLPGADRLWSVIDDKKPTVCTGCPKTNFKTAASLKIEWWQDTWGVPRDRVITCLSKDKALFCSVKGDVLVDDLYPNIKRWRAAGGIGIHHRSVEQTIFELQQFGII